MIELEALIMRLNIIAIGRQKNDPTFGLTQNYFNRLPCAGSIIELEKSKGKVTVRALDESNKISEFLRLKGLKGHRLIVMDKRGKDISTEKLAELIQGWRNQSVPESYFVIGGANGHSEKLINTADCCLKFGNATWPHLLFRAMVAEQLYRAEMILKNHPYHTCH